MQYVSIDLETTGLDPAQIRSMRELIHQLAEQHTVILSSHILAEVEQTCNHIIVIAGGRIAALGTPAELRHRVVGPSRLIAEVRGEADEVMAAAIKHLSGVSDVVPEKAGNWTRMIIRGDADSDPRAEIFQLAASKKWQLRELRREVGSLEDFFIQITYEQNMRQKAQTTSH